MGKVQALRQLDRHIIDVLDVGAGHIDAKVEIQTLDVLEDIAIIIVLDHGKMCLTVIISETVERSYNVGMRLKIDPASDIFIIGYLADHELLSEVLVVDDEGRVTDHMLDLLLKT